MADPAQAERIDGGGVAMTAAHNGGGEMPISYGSVCSGIEAASVAWHPLGWIPAWFAEIEPFPSAVLAHHWPTVANLGDFTAIRGNVASGEVDAPDVLVGGTPCQAFSVAGLRQSLDDKRGQLTLEFVRLANAIDSARSLRGQHPVTVVWENVPGVLNTPDNAFGCFLAGLVGEDDPLVAPGGRWSNAGYVRGPARAAAWRILDAQYFGVAQRRRRVFVVASAGGVRPEQVLFEFDGVRRDFAPRREAGQGTSHDVAPCATSSRLQRIGERTGNDPIVAVPVAPTIPSRSSVGGGLGADFDLDGGMVLQAFGGNRTRGPIDVSSALNACGTASGRQDFESDAFVTVGFNARQDPDSWEGRTGPLDTDGGTQAVAVGMLAIRGREGGSSLEARYDGTSNAILTPSGGRAGMGVGAIHCGMQVRRLTPTECERLQGFPDGHTLIPWKLGYWPEGSCSLEAREAIAEQCPDGPRYKALGNSMAVPVMRWIGARIARQLEVRA